MKTFTAGKFEVEVSDPSPAWITLRAESTNGDRAEIRIHPDDIEDLLYALSRARSHANLITSTPAWIREFYK